jgi:hypothetical protein
MRCQLHGFDSGSSIPGSHEIGPFSCSKPSSDEHPGCQNASAFVRQHALRGAETQLTPPLSQIRISSFASEGSGAAVGQNQKKSFPSLLPPIGSRPEYDSPTSKGMLGRPVPFTANSA